MKDDIAQDIKHNDNIIDKLSVLQFLANKHGDKKTAQECKEEIDYLTQVNKELATVEPIVYNSPIDCQELPW